MPELAEVAYFARQWEAGKDQKIQRVHLHEATRVFRDLDTVGLQRELPGRFLRRLETRGKQMLFGFSRGGWLGVHLGMAGELLSATTPYAPDRHDHLVLFTSKVALVFRDYRQFGRIRWETGAAPPVWWEEIPPSVLDEAFTREALRDFLQRHRKAPIKAVLIDQRRFPGLGNWMVDEILWRSRIHPGCPAGRIERQRLSRLYEKIREVARQALEVIAVAFADPPDSWLMNHRWKDGGLCPQTGKALVRRPIGGRTTCFSPAWQTWPADLREKPPKPPKQPRAPRRKDRAAHP